MRNKDFSLEELVYAFLQKGREGECWDFKQEWHEKMSDLIKDIICFANTVHDEDCYLIFGISDDLRVTGMAQTRMKQSDIIDALSNLIFAGDIVPQISVDTIEYDGKQLDILTVKNVDDTPVFLKKAYGSMRAGCIYVRNGDKNTPDNGNADVRQIENLWKKRFGLTKPPLEYAFDRLQNKLEWKESGDYTYNIYKPEITLHLYLDDEIEYGADEYYAYSQTNESCSFGMLDILVHGTVLYSRQTVWLDSGRLCVPVPEWGFISSGYSENISYKYYVRGSKIFMIQQFLYDPDNMENHWAYRKLMDIVLLFKDEEEHKRFESYVLDNIDRLKDTVKHDESYDYIVTQNDNKTQLYKERLRYGKALRLMLFEMRDATQDNHQSY